MRFSVWYDVSSPPIGFRNSRPRPRFKTPTMLYLAVAWTRTASMSSATTSASRTLSHSLTAHLEQAEVDPSRFEVLEHDGLGVDTVLARIRVRNKRGAQVGSLRGGDLDVPPNV